MIILHADQQKWDSLSTQNILLFSFKALIILKLLRFKMEILKKYLRISLKKREGLLMKLKISLIRKKDKRFWMKYLNKMKKIITGCFLIWNKKNNTMIIQKILKIKYTI